MELTDMEKSVVKEAVKSLNEIQQVQQSIQQEVARRQHAAETIVNTIVKLRGLDPTKYQMKFDVAKEEYSLEELPPPNPPAEQTEGPSPEARVLQEGEVQVIAEMADGRKVELDGSKAEVLTMHSGSDGPPKSIAPAINMKDMERRITES